MAIIYGWNVDPIAQRSCMIKFEGIGVALWRKFMNRFHFARLIEGVRIQWIDSGVQLERGFIVSDMNLDLEIIF